MYTATWSESDWASGLKVAIAVSKCEFKNEHSFNFFCSFGCKNLILGKLTIRRGENPVHKPICQQKLKTNILTNTTTKTD